MARFTRSRVFGATRSLPDRTRETVDFDTPARRATSTIVTRPPRSPASSRPVDPDTAFAAFWNVPLERTKWMLLLTCAAKRPQKRHYRVGRSCHLERAKLSLNDCFAPVND